jgi:hypothetical protein
MRKVLGLALGILTAIGGFLDIGDLVTNAVVGLTIRALAWVGSRGWSHRHLRFRSNGRAGGRREWPGHI